MDSGAVCGPPPRRTFSTTDLFILVGLRCTQRGYHPFFYPASLPFTLCPFCPADRRRPAGLCRPMAATTIKALLGDAGCAAAALSNRAQPVVIYRAVCRVWSGPQSMALAARSHPKRQMVYGFGYFGHLPLPAHHRLVDPSHRAGLRCFANHRSLPGATAGRQRRFGANISDGL